LQQGGSAVCQGHVYAIGSGIDGVFHQFLNDRGRSLDDLTGGYLAGYV